MRRTKTTLPALVALAVALTVASTAAFAVGTLLFYGQGESFAENDADVAVWDDNNADKAQGAALERPRSGGQGAAGLL